MLSRRSVLISLSTTALAGTLAASGGLAFAADKTVKVGINLPFTGADAHDAELIKDGADAGDRRSQRRGRCRRLQDRRASARRRHRHRRPIRSGPGRHQRAQDGLRRFGRRRDRPADERLGQGDVADPEPGQSRDDHARPRPIPTSPTRNSPRNTGPAARRSISARSPPTPFRARTWRIISPTR